jgi:O-antigen/teichoic acid export membrane protein
MTAADLNRPTPSRRQAAQVTLAAGNVQVLFVVVSGLLLVPLYISHLGSSLYGWWLATGDVLAWFGIFEMGVAGIMGQRMAVGLGRGANRAAGEYLGTGLLLQLLLGVGLVVFSFTAAPFIPRLLDVADADAAQLVGAFRLAAAGAAGGILLGGVSQALLAFQRAGVPAVAAVVSQVVAVAVTLWLLLGGAGLWALAAAPVVRAGVGLLITCPYAIRVIVQEAGVTPVLSRRALNDYLSLVRPVLAGMLGNMAANRSDAVIIGILGQPELVVLYVITRRMAELIGLVLAKIGGAVFTPFAHLVGSGEHRKAFGIVSAVGKMYWAAGIVLIVVYLALNEAFIRLWVGPEHFGGIALTVAVAISILCVGYASLLSYLLGGTGQLARNGYYILAEAAVRVVLMLGLFSIVGLIGLPLGAAISSTTLSAAAYVSIRDMLAPASRPPRPDLLWLVVAMMAAGATGFAMVRISVDWFGLTVAGLVLGSFAAGCMLLTLWRYEEFSPRGILPLLPRFFPRASVSS